jgi:glycosyltransferase involved in cell wall biosynthesis
MNTVPTKNVIEPQKQQLTILHVAPITHDYVAGLTFSIPALVNVLHRIGVTTGILTTSPLGPYTKAEPYPIVYVRDLPGGSAIASMPEPLNNPDLIIFHSTYLLTHAFLAHEARRRKTPYVITPRGGMTKGAQHIKRLKKLIGNFLFFNRMVRQSVALHCLTENEADDIKVWSRPVFVVGNGVDLPSSNLLACPGNHEDLKFLFLGRLDIHHKGLDLLLEACSMIQSALRTAKVQLHLYGSEVGESRTKLMELINTYQIQDFVYLQSPVWGDSKQAIFQTADLFIHTSRFEGHPMAVLEALSYGVPCLLTPGTNMAEEVASTGAGWAVEAQPLAIANGLCAALESRMALQEKGRAARNLVEEKYTWEQIGSLLVKEYLKIVN